VPGAAHDGPEQDLADVAGDFRGVGGEVVGCGADVGEVAVGGQGE
jgi:hypothetical protein